MLLDVTLDALLDSAKLFPFLYLTYLFMEWLEHGAGERFEGAIAKAGSAGPLIGAVLGVIPQCGFCGAAATLYAARIVGLGTLVSVFLATSDEMLPVMISQAASPVLIAKILGIKVVVGMVSGFVLDAALRATGRGHVGFGNVHAHIGHEGYDIRELCEQDGCECTDGCSCAGQHHGHEAGHGHEHAHHDATIGHLAGAALKHSLQVTLLVFVICLVLNLVVEAGLEDAIAVVAQVPLAGCVITAVLGLIPNCAVSVALTQLYLDGVLTGGSMMSGLLVNAGVGLIVLFRTNNDSRENLRICGLLVAIGIVAGLAIEISGVL